MSETSLQQIASNAAQAHVEFRDARTIPYEVGRLGEITDVLNAKLAQLEDRLGPVRTPFDSIKGDHVGQPQPATAPLAENLRAISVGVERAIERLEQMLIDIEL